MIDFKVTSKNGNVARFFPHTGYFGVTPVVVAGTLHTHLLNDEPLNVRSVEVGIRCIEVRESGPLRSSREHVLYQTSSLAWTPPTGAEEQAIGNWDCPFKVVVPPEAAEFARSSQTTREWRVRWKLDVIVNHKPIAYVGDCIARAYDIRLYDHRTPTTSLPSPPSGWTLGSGSTATGVFLTPPTGVYGPLDTIDLSFSAQPHDPSTIVRKTRVTLDRRMELFDAKGSSRSSSPSRDEGNPSKSSRISTLFGRGVSPRRSTPSGPGADNESRTIVSRIVEGNGDLSSTSANGTCWTRASVNLPGRGVRWDVGETQTTDLVTVTFELRVKVTVQTRKGTLKELSSDTVPVTIVASTAAERSAAQEASSTQPVRYSKRKYGSQGMFLHRAQETDVQSILRKEELDDGLHASVSFATPSTTPPPCFVVDDDALGGDAERNDSLSPISMASTVSSSRRVSLPPIQAFFSSPYPSSTPSPSVDHEGHYHQEADYSVGGGGRRISTTTSDEEDLQPLRSRPKLYMRAHDVSIGHDVRSPLVLASRPHGRARPALPSLDALGLGLPHVPEDNTHASRQRPRTAPAFGVYAAKSPTPPGGSSSATKRPASSGGLTSFAFVVPQPPTCEGAPAQRL